MEAKENENMREVKKAGFYAHEERIPYGFSYFIARIVQKCAYTSWVCD